VLQTLLKVRFDRLRFSGISTDSKSFKTVCSGLRASVPGFKKRRGGNCRSFDKTFKISSTLAWFLLFVGSCKKHSGSKTVEKQQKSSFSATVGCAVGSNSLLRGRSQNRSMFPTFLRYFHLLVFYLTKSPSDKCRTFMLLYLVHVKIVTSQICPFSFSLPLLGESTSRMDSLVARLGHMRLFSVNMAVTALASRLARLIVQCRSAKKIVSFEKVNQCLAVYYVTSHQTNKIL